MLQTLSIGSTLLLAAEPPSSDEGPTVPPPAAGSLQSIVASVVSAAYRAGPARAGPESESEEVKGREAAEEPAEDPDRQALFQAGVDALGQHGDTPLVINLHPSLATTKTRTVDRRPVDGELRRWLWTWLLRVRPAVLASTKASLEEAVSCGWVLISRWVACFASLLFSR